MLFFYLIPVIMIIRSRQILVLPVMPHLAAGLLLMGLPLASRVGPGMVAMRGSADGVLQIELRQAPLQQALEALAKEEWIRMHWPTIIRLSAITRR